MIYNHFRTTDVLVDFCRAYYIPDELTRLSGFHQTYKHFTRSDQNSVTKAYICGYSINTLKKHLCIRDFFCSNKVQHLYEIIPALNLYVIKCCEHGKPRSSLLSIIESLRFFITFLQLKALQNDTFYYLKRYVKKFAKKASRKRLGLRQVHVDKIIKKVENSKPLSACFYRSYVMIIFMYFTICRFDCASRIQMANIQYHNEYLDITVPKSKTDQEGNGQKIYLPHKASWSPHRLICSYLHKLGHQEETAFLFSPLKWDKVCKKWKFNPEKPISYKAAYSGFKRFLIYCDIDCKNFSLHSLRIGGTTDLFERRVPGKVIDAKGRWKNKATKHLYNHSKKTIREDILKFA